jgi:hypothetical protein
VNILELMLKAVRGTVSEGVNQVLEGIGLGEAPPGEPPPAEPRPPAAEAPSTEPPGSEPAKKPAVEVVDAVFPAASDVSAPAEPAAPAAEPMPAATEPPAAVVPPEAGETRIPPPEAAEEAPQPVPETVAADAAPSQSDMSLVLDLLRSRGGRLRGFEIAEATGIAPWWRLKDVLHRLVRDGFVEQTEDGLFSLRQDRDA